MSCNSNSKHLDMHARMQSNPNQNCAYCYFYIAAHPRSTLNCSCVAQVPASSDSVSQSVSQRSPDPLQTPPTRTCPRSFPCVGRIGTERFLPQGGVGPHSLPPRAEPTTASVLSSSDTAHCVYSSPCYTACSSGLIHVSDRDKVNVEMPPDEMPQGVSQPVLSVCNTWIPTQ